jgi:hypothetical protein
MKNRQMIVVLVLLVAIVGVIVLTGKSKTPSVNTTAQSHRSYTLKSDSAGKAYTVNTPSKYSFSIADDQGNTVKNFAVTHTKLMHVIVVRKDLAYFQHVHPEFDQTTGTFILKDLIFPADGMYRIFADFAVNGNQMDAMGMSRTTTLNEDVSVGTSTNYKPQVLSLIHI